MMKRKKNTYRVLTLLGIGSLLLLFLLSPCKVRNAIQASLGLEQTAVLNVSKTAFETASCSGIDNLQVSNSFLKVSPKTTTGASLIPVLVTLPIIASTYSTFIPNKKWNKSVPFIPYYILFRNFKAYL